LPCSSDMQTPLPHTKITNLQSSILTMLHGPKSEVHGQRARSVFCTHLETHISYLAWHYTYYLFWDFFPNLSPSLVEASQQAQWQKVHPTRKEDMSLQPHPYFPTTVLLTSWTSGKANQAYHTPPLGVSAN
jgi:hypothetical protein